MLKSGEHSTRQLRRELGVSVWSLKRSSKEFPVGEPTGPGAFRAGSVSTWVSKLLTSRSRNKFDRWSCHCSVGSEPPEFFHLNIHFRSCEPTLRAEKDGKGIRG